MFCLLRLGMGCFFGGEYAVGHTFAIEHAPAGKRGLIGGFIQSGFPAGYVIATLVAGTSAGFWYLLPRNGKEHTLVQNTGVGSMVTIVILTLFIVGVAVMCEDLLS